MNKAHFKGTHVYAPITRRGYWQFTMDDVTVGNDTSECWVACSLLQVTKSTESRLGGAGRGK